jgi:hypothetical protein
MMILGDQRQELIDSLEFSESLKSLTRGEYVHDELEFRCQSLKYALEPEDFSPEGINVIPLWESNSSITGFYFDKNSMPVYIHYYVEDIEDYKIIGQNKEDLINFLVEEYVDYEYENEVKSMLTRS